MELLQLLAQFLQGITSWLPRPYLVNVTQRSVRFRRGTEAALVEPGFHVNVPLFSTIEDFSLLKDATEFEPVVLPTKDGKTVAIGFVIVWHIDEDNVVRAATSTDDLVGMIGEVGESLLPPLVLMHTYDEILDRVRGGRNLKTVNESLMEDAQDLLREFGVTVDTARINFGPVQTRVTRHLHGLNDGVPVVI